VRSKRRASKHYKKTYDAGHDRDDGTDYQALTMKPVTLIASVETFGRGCWYGRVYEMIIQRNPALYRRTAGTPDTK